ncbi:hypothetical protein ACTFIY_007990 [Dictyostelium cf. discoideum]
MKKKIYDSLIKFSSDFDSQDIGNTKIDMNLPLKFHKGWIISMLDRFKLIIKTLKESINFKISHQQLFKVVHPLASLFYKLASKEIGGNPLDQIYHIYDYNEIDTKKKINLEFKYLLNKHSNLPHELDKHLKQLNSIQPLSKPDLTIVETIKELLLVSKVKHFDCPITFLKLILQFINNFNSKNNDNNNNNNRETFIFHKSWIESNYIILIKLFQTIKSKNDNLCNQIQFLVEFGEDINRIHENSTPLDLAVQTKQFQTFVKIIELGGGLNANNENIKNYYSTLTHDQKCQLKPLIENQLFHINPNLIWELSLDYLLPIIKDEEIDNKNNKIIFGLVNKRKISETIWNTLFNSNGEPNKPIERGKRSVVLIENKEYGLGIYFKFKPQFPDIEYSVGKLSEKLFGSISHNIKLSIKILKVYITCFGALINKDSLWSSN